MNSHRPRTHSRQHLPFSTVYGYTYANPEFYAPLREVSEAGRRFEPSTVPPGWAATRYDVWTAWNALGIVKPDEGWKVHVSARIDRAQEVLDKVAQICFSESVSFKHIRAELFFIVLHHKHGPR